MQRLLFTIGEADCISIYACVTTEYYIDEPVYCMQQSLLIWWDLVVLVSVRHYQQK
jgi:hypothetical protein